MDSTEHRDRSIVHEYDRWLTKSYLDTLYMTADQLVPHRWQRSVNDANVEFIEESMISNGLYRGARLHAFVLEGQDLPADTDNLSPEFKVEVFCGHHRTLAFVNAQKKGLLLGHRLPVKVYDRG
jgi:hypothetical protein